MDRRALVLVSMAVLLGGSSIAAQPPGGRGGRPGGFRAPNRRPAIFDVTGEKLLDLNPIAKLLKEQKKLELGDELKTRLDSLNTALLAEVTPFATRIDSLKPRGRPEGGERPEGGFGGGRPGGRPSGTRGGADEGGASGPDPGEGIRRRFEQLQLTIGMIKLRYDAAVLSAERMLGPEREDRIGKLLEKGQHKMEEYAAPLGRQP